jgi:hypothetical protein
MEKRLRDTLARSQEGETSAKRDKIPPLCSIERLGKQIALPEIE